ncbi:MAG: hypothetical protein WCH34_07625 [Bacteroidota bacterium]
MLHTVNIKLDFDQLLSIVEQCSSSQKLAIVKALEKDTYKARFKQLLSELKKNDLSSEDVLNEVEIVRQKRYEQGNKTNENSY